MFLFTITAALLTAPEPADMPRSHPPLRKVPPAPKRTITEAAAYFVDAQKGDDNQDGGKEKPWKTLGRALRELKAGDTLYLRGGVYYENVAVRLVARKDKPITIASFPGEQAILDGGLREFFEQAGAAWQPFPDGSTREFRSARRYPNLRNVVAAFGDSMIGLQSYYHLKDLRATNEKIEQEADKSDIKPMYCGPGLWYDRTTGYLHARLAPTHLPGLDNYKGEIDPRRVPLVVAPLHSTPLHFDKAEHVVIQDLIIRGGGYETVRLDQALNIIFDNSTVWCGTYGMRALGTRGLKLHRSALHGSIAPWSTRYEAGFNSYPGRSERDITRLNTHALLIADANREFSVYCYPFNDDWEISHCDFTDASDGLYLGGVSMKFHHNRVENMHDDGVYLSPMYPRHIYLRAGAKIEMSENIFSRCLTTLAFGGTEGTQDVVYFTRNIVDLRTPVPTARPAAKGDTGIPYYGKVIGDHGSPPWTAMHIYHNTFVVRTPAGADMVLTAGAVAERPRRVFNNILLHLGELPAYQPPASTHVHADGNLYWQPGLDAKRAEAFFKAFRASTAFDLSKKVYPPGLESHSRAVDPRLTRGEKEGVNDYRLQAGSPAVDSGIDIPADWPDPLRKADKGKPDIGALPLGSEAIKAGRQ